MTKNLSKSSLYGCFVWFLASFFYLYQFVLRASPNVMSEDLMISFSIHASSLGLLSSCYYYSYTLLQIPSGILIDRFGPQKIIRSAAILCVLGSVLMSVSESFFWACASRVLIGSGASAILLSTISLSRLWLSPGAVAFAIGSTLALGKLGGILANAPLAFLVQKLGWRLSMLVLSMPGVFIATLIWLFLKHKEASFKEPFSKKSLLFVIQSPQIWLLGLYGCFMYVPLSVFTDVWGVLFMMKKYGITKTAAAWSVSFVLMGTAFGSLVAALASKILGSRRQVMIISAAFSTLVSAYLVFNGQSFSVLTISTLFLFGFFMTGQTLIFTSAADYVPHETSGTATGFVNSLVMMGGVLFQPIVGFILDFLWAGEKDLGAPSYDLSAFQTALSVIPAVMFLAFWLSFFIKKPYAEGA